MSHLLLLPLLVSADPPAAPEFAGVTAWANGPALKMADQRGKVVVVHFWTHICINCVRNYPHYRKWQDAFAGKDVVLVGVHTPEFDTDKELDRIKAAAKKEKLTFRIAVDNDFKVWRAWGNRYWPTVYVVDKAGKVRERWEGELGEAGEKKMREVVEGLLKEK